MIHRYCLPALYLGLAATLYATAGAQETRDSKPPAAAPADAPREGDKKDAPKIVKFPGVVVNIAEGIIDLDGEICKRDGQLELFATLKGKREHESIVRLTARPSLVHAGLVMLDVKPGKPGYFTHAKVKIKDEKGQEVMEDQWTAHNPTGGKVSVSVIYTTKDGKTHEVSMKNWLRHKKTGKPAENDQFVFAGSKLQEIKPVEFDEEGNPKPSKQPARTVYLADTEGAHIALVTFGFEVMAWPETASDSDDRLVWEANTDALPPLDSKVTLRLRKVAGSNPPADGAKPGAAPGAGDKPGEKPAEKPAAKP